MTKTPHIVFHFAHGFSARMVLRAGVARRLTDRGIRVTAISPNANEHYFQQECLGEGVNLKQEPSSTGRVAHWFRMYRPYFLDDVMNNNALRAMHHRRLERHPVAKAAWELVNRRLAKKVITRKIFKGVELWINRSREIESLLGKEIDLKKNFESARVLVRKLMFFDRLGEEISEAYEALDS